MKNKKAILKILKEVKAKVKFKRKYCEKNCLLTLIFMKFLSEQQEKKISQDFIIKPRFLFKNILQKLEKSKIKFKLIGTEPDRILYTLDSGFLEYEFKDEDLIFENDKHFVDIFISFYEALNIEYDVKPEIFQEIENRVFNMAKIVNEIEILNLLDDKKVYYKEFLTSLSEI
jgi:hypothetical protein